VLYDFADIESYDPDALVNYMPLHADDACNYDGGNWCIAWQNSHGEESTVRRQCGAHPALNGNLKAYAAWWLWHGSRDGPARRTVCRTSRSTT